VNRKADFFYKTNRFESIRITNRIESIRIANWNALVTVTVVVFVDPLKMSKPAKLEGWHIVDLYTNVYRLWAYFTLLTLPVTLWPCQCRSLSDSWIQIPEQSMWAERERRNIRSSVTAHFYNSRSPLRDLPLRAPLQHHRILPCPLTASPQIPRFSARCAPLTLLSHAM